MSNQAQYLMMMGALAEMPKEMREDTESMENELLDLIGNSDYKEKELWVLAMGLVAGKWEAGKLDLEEVK